jgi:AraC family transcriptional regulator
VLAERWQHSEGDLGEVMPRDTEVIVMLDGCLRVRRRGDGRLQQHHAVPGTVWLCPAGVREDLIHLYGDIRESVHMYLPALPLSKAALEELDVDPARVRLRYDGGFRDPVIETIGRAVAAELECSDPASGLLVETLATALGVYIVRNHSNLSATSAPLASTKGALEGTKLARVLAYVEAHLEGEVRLEDLAREACLSAFHFARSFKAAVGMSPHAFVLQRRLERARNLLQGTALSLAEVASACGFCSQAHLSTCFKRETGVTPGLFRHASATGQLTARRLP